MAKPAIWVDRISKRYPLNKTRNRGYRTLRDSVSESLYSAGRGLYNRIIGTDKSENEKPNQQTFWALRDISFEVMPGEVVGIIGRNGAGKSTLLKILSMIVEPTSGRCGFRGRLASLLEVGTGFHPELSGRENIYLNGSLLGMKRKEIDRRFDEIVAFSEIDQFIDTPVKRYSSGMYVRLAFSVAAHLDMEILLVDEVLAVGDAKFQEKCMGKMEEVSKGNGRTILFISHNPHAMLALTQRAVFIDSGNVKAIGKTRDVLHQYMSPEENNVGYWKRTESCSQHKDVEITHIRVCNDKGDTASHVKGDEPFTIEVCFTARTSSIAQIAYRLINEDGLTIFTSGHSDDKREKGTLISPGTYRAVCHIPPQYVAPGVYHLLVAANNFHGKQFDLVERALQFEINSLGALTEFDQRQGLLTPTLHWTVSPA